MSLVIRLTLLLVALYAGHTAIATDPAGDPQQSLEDGNGLPPPPKP